MYKSGIWLRSLIITRGKKKKKNSAEMDENQKHFRLQK